MRSTPSQVSASEVSARALVLGDSQFTSRPWSKGQWGSVSLRLDEVRR